MCGLDKVLVTCDFFFIFFFSVTKNPNLVHLQGMSKLIGFPIKWGLVLRISEYVY